MSQVVFSFAFLFPGNAMVNSILATSYISIIPNLLLWFVPPDIKPSTLNLYVNFAVGSLLGDVFLHLLPHSFNSHNHSEEKAHTRGNEEHKSVLMGVAIFAGLFFFYATDKFARAYLGRTGHDHTHETKRVDQVVDQVAVSEPKEGLRQRNTKCSTKTNEKEDMAAEKDHHHHHRHDTDIHASTYLSLIADFTHNLMDGIAMAASFYASPAVGATTAVAVFFHEIPHEFSDYAILLQAGFSKKRAMMAQFTTAIGAYIGTFIGIIIQEMAASLSNTNEDSHHLHDHRHHHHGLLGTGLTLGDLVLPATAGAFLYIATVGVIPDLLTNKPKSKLQPLKELSAMITGLALMAGIAWTETHHH